MSQSAPTIYCVVCQHAHQPPVAVAVNDSCWVADCEREMFCFHAATGDDMDCVCGEHVLPAQPAQRLLTDEDFG